MIYLTDDVLEALGKSEVTDHKLVMPPLERQLYVRVNKVLTAAGGKWDRRQGGHVFDDDPAEIVADIMTTRQVQSRTSELGYFPTPAPVIEKLMAAAQLEPGMTVLEPSAGRGAIVEAIALRRAMPDAVEIDGRNFAALERQGLAGWLKQADFLEVDPVIAGPGYDRVIMNPPFAPMGTDIRHVLHALKFLRPGGLLVSVMSLGVTFRQDRLSREFRDLVAGTQDGEIVRLPDSSFKVSGTGIHTVMAFIPDER